MPSTKSNKIHNSTARQINKLSKDLEAVINDRSEGDNSSIAKDKIITTGNEDNANK